MCDGLDGWGKCFLAIMADSGCVMWRTSRSFLRSKDGCVIDGDVFLAKARARLDERGDTLNIDRAPKDRDYPGRQDAATDWLPTTWPTRLSAPARSCVGWQALTERERYAVADHVVAATQRARRPLASVRGTPFAVPIIFEGP